MFIIKDLRQSPRFRITAFLALITLFCFALSLLRAQVTGTRAFLFLNWNLFLAIIPWVASSSVMLIGRLRNNRFSLWLLLVTWLLFFPNSPYILTDLFHLRTVHSAPLWFDLMLILLFAWTALCFGFISLNDIEKLLSGKFSRKYVVAIIVMLLFASGFGIYLGRFLRWNSWDIVQQPLKLLADIADRFIHPLSHPRTWAVTLLMGALLNMMYWSIHLMRKGTFDKINRIGI